MVMIETVDLCKQFGDFWAVNGVTLKVEPGQILALLGQNGAGKTTTVRMLNALLTPTHGSARIAGYDVVNEPVAVRASVGVLTEQHGLYNRMTGDEYLDFFSRIYGLDPATRNSRIRYLLDYFDLAQVSRKRIGEYSKGMRQKLALARALIHEPPVLLLDEPTSAMDPESARLVRDEIANLRSTQRTIVICTHNLTEAEMLADKIAIIYRGRLLVNGTLDQLKTKVLGSIEYEVRLAEPWGQGTLSLPKEVTLLEKNGNTLRFQVSDPADSNPKVVRELVKRSLPLVSLQEVPRSLEHVYLNIMKKATEEEKYA